MLLSWDDAKRAGRLLRVLLVVVVLVAVVSAYSITSYDSLPFRSQHFGAPPTPYFLSSEEGIGYYVSNVFAGRISCDEVFATYFMYKHSSNSLLVDYTSEGLFVHGNAWLIRAHELSDRGLEYNNGFTGQSFSLSEVSIFINQPGFANRVADTGTSQFFLSLS
jgi:hypothetical protein